MSLSVLGPYSCQVDDEPLPDTYHALHYSNRHRSYKSSDADVDVDAVEPGPVETDNDTVVAVAVDHNSSAAVGVAVAGNWPASQHRLDSAARNKSQPLGYTPLAGRLDRHRAVLDDAAAALASSLPAACSPVDVDVS